MIYNRVSGGKRDEKFQSFSSAYTFLLLVTEVNRGENVTDTMSVLFV